MRQHLFQIEFLGEDDDVRGGLQLEVPLPDADLLCQRAERRLRLVPRGTGGRLLAARRRDEDRVQQVERQLVAQAVQFAAGRALSMPNQVQRSLIAKRPVQFALHGVQQHVDFIEQEDTAVEHPQDLPTHAHLPCSLPLLGGADFAISLHGRALHGGGLHRGAVGFGTHEPSLDPHPRGHLSFLDGCELPDALNLGELQQELNLPQDDALQRCGRSHDGCTVASCGFELDEQSLRQRHMPVEAERKHRPRQDGR
mmetsp:Transcript_160243/g.514125  ORF Transcript_160243/g.514125 Transcript_160243/m.514125 type:complete len:254 (-) Transcript_160243:4050-4811(-)